MNTSNYYPHIDGLRTIAVLSVFLFHLDAALLPGGFLGVDIFFVISGYLITGIIVNALKENQFSIGTFYMRRIRRIYPTFITMLLCSYVLAVAFLTPAELVNFSESALSSLFSVSNIYFYFNRGYFDVASQDQLLLHTWSLGVEEQFYLFWPFFLVFLFKKLSLARGFVLLASFTFVCFLVSWLVTYRSPNMAFYLMPFRVFEFCIGGLLCWLPGRLAQNTKYDGISWVALFGLLACFFFINEDMLIPGWVTLLPCLVCALLIYRAGADPFVNSVLSHSWMVFLGKASYAIYLFHWPAILFYRKIVNPVIGVFDAFTIVASVIAISIVVTKFIETPIRQGRWGLNSGVRMSTVFSLSLLVGVALLSHSIYSKGYEGVFGDEFTALSAEVDFQKKKRIDVYREMCKARGWENCTDPVEGKSNVLILGDSHGIDGLNIFKEAFSDHHYVLKSVPGCVPQDPEVFSSSGNRKHPNFHKCLDLLTDLKKPSSYEDYEYLVISSRYLRYEPSLLYSILDVVPERLLDKTLIFGNAPSFLQDLPSILIRNKSMDISGDKLANYFEKGVLHQEDGVKFLVSRYGISYLSKLDFYCPKMACKLFYGKEQKLLTYDKHHLSYAAAREYGDFLAMKYLSLDNLLNSTKIAK